jgi:hypothetical protein
MTTPIDHLADKSGLHVELLRELTDEQLAEQIAYYSECEAKASNARDHWGHSKLAHTASLVQRERNGGPTVEEWEAEVERLEDELGI